jgi:hypothetical protein
MITPATAPAGAHERTTRGGKRSRPGRPPRDRERGATDARITARLHTADVAFVCEIGGGSISQGLRFCIEAARQQQQQLLQLQQQQVAAHASPRPGWPTLRSRARAALATLLPH